MLSKDGCRLYDHFDYIADTYEKHRGNIEGKLIYWTLKEDGSNCGLYYNTEGQRCVASRRVHRAKFEENVMKLPVVQDIFDMMDDLADRTGDTFIVYGEYMPRGWSPTNIKYYETDSFTVFDIFNVRTDEYLPFPEANAICKSYGIPFCKLVFTSRAKSLEDLKMQGDIALKVIDEKEKSFHLKLHRWLCRLHPKNEEGVVGKIYCEGYHIYFKHKFGGKKLAKVKVPREPTPEKEQLDYSELCKCVRKVYDELGYVDFSDTRIAMPKVAEEVAMELKETGTMNRVNLMSVYLDVLNKIKENY